MSMPVLLHVLFALSSLAFTAYMLFRPSARKLRISGNLIAGTIGSGTYLLVSTPSHLLEGCLMGLIYLALTIAGTVAVRRKLAADATRPRS